LVVVVAGLGGLQKPLTEENVFRSDRFAALSGLSEGQNITTQALVKVLMHPTGGLKNIPSTARRIALLNQADTIELQSQANEMSTALLGSYDAVVVAALEIDPMPVKLVREKIAAIILAGGASTRFGKPKQLLDYHGQPFVRVVSETAIGAGLDPVIVVSGASAEAVSAAVEGLLVNVVHNQDWQAGQSASIKAGLAGLSGQEGGAIFLLADQPQVSVELLRALVQEHSQELSPILAPYVFDRRANPLLFDRVTFPDLLTISGDTGGRAIFSKYSPRYLTWYDRRLLLDVDTPEDYQRLLGFDHDV
jgi:molybdenum cofactor cytidylyltransferase